MASSAQRFIWNCHFSSQRQEEGGKSFISDRRRSRHLSARGYCNQSRNLDSCGLGSSSLVLEIFEGFLPYGRFTRAEVEECAEGPMKMNKANGNPFSAIGIYSGALSRPALHLSSRLLLFYLFDGPRWRC